MRLINVDEGVLVLDDTHHRLIEEMRQSVPFHRALLKKFRRQVVTSQSPTYATELDSLTTKAL